jgi:hypothetical protein
MSHGNSENGVGGGGDHDDVVNDTVGKQVNKGGKTSAQLKKFHIMEIIYAVLVIIYVICLIGYFADPVLSIARENTSLLTMCFFWSTVKILVPLTAIFYSIFSVTNMPLTQLMGIVILASLANSATLVILIMIDGTTCNSNRSSIYNPCNDPLYCCVFYQKDSDPANSICSNGPCINASYIPKRANELFANPPFLALVVYTILLLLLELAIAFIVSKLRSRRVKVENNFFKEITNKFNKIFGKSSYMGKKII